MGSSGCSHLEHHAAIEQLGVVAVDHAPERGGDEHLARRREELLRADLRGSVALEVGDPSATTEVIGERVGVEPGVGAQGAEGVGRRDQRASEALHDPGRHEPTLPKPWMTTRVSSGLRSSEGAASR